MRDIKGMDCLEWIVCFLVVFFFENGGGGGCLNRNIDFGIGFLERILCIYVLFLI